MLWYSLVSVHINAVGVVKHSQHFLLSKNKHAGFSLLELIVVMMVISILAIMAIPRFINAGNIASINYFDETLSSIRYAQKLAVAMGCDVQVATTTNSLELFLRHGCRVGDFTIPVHDPITGRNFVRLAPAGVGIHSVELPIYFDRLGRAHKNTGQIANAHVNLVDRIITIVAETGFIYEQK